MSRYNFDGKCSNCGEEFKPGFEACCRLTMLEHTEPYKSYTLYFCKECARKLINIDELNLENE